VGSIAGIGNDIIAIARIRRSYEKYGDLLLNRLLTLEEIKYCLQFTDPAARLAGRFAAKESIIKALSSGVLRWKEIEILNNREGKPNVFFAPSLVMRFGFNPIVLLSISHCDTFATSVAIWVK
jgi:holo-[acyl-carrier protein] synthase